MNKTCKTCKFWDYGICNKVDQVYDDYNGKEKSILIGKSAAHFFIDTTVADDTNLNVTMRTGPDFGCILHEQMS